MSMHAPRLRGPCVHSRRRCVDQRCCFIVFETDSVPSAPAPCRIPVTSFPVDPPCACLFSQSAKLVTNDFERYKAMVKKIKTNSAIRAKLG